MDKLSLFFISLLQITAKMAPYLLLGFFVAGILHVYVPKNFFRKYLSQNNFKSILTATLLGIPLPLCSCGVIPTAVGLKNEGASKGAVASFLIATPQTGIDSIIATFSMMGLGFAIIRPVAALITGICGGIFISLLCKKNNEANSDKEEVRVESVSGNKIVAVLQYSFVEMIRSIGGRLVLGLILAAVIQVVIPDSFFLQKGDSPLAQMGIMILIAVPMYVCSTGSIPIAAALLAKGLTPGAALVLLMAGPAVNLASMMVVKKVMGLKFTAIYIGTVVVGAFLFGIILNNSEMFFSSDSILLNNCCLEGAEISILSYLSSIVLILCLLNAVVMSLFKRFKKQENIDSDYHTFKVDGMHCVHCKAAVEIGVSQLKGVKSVLVDLDKKEVSVKGEYKTKDIKKVVEELGFKMEE